MEFNYINFGFLFLIFWFGFFINQYRTRIKDWILSLIRRVKNG